MADFFDQRATDYDDQFQRPVDIAENRFLFDRLGPFTHGVTLDVGCGTGLALDYCRFERYLGIDLSSGMVTQARLKHPRQNFAVMDMRLIGSLGPRRFDTVISTFGSISYVLDRPDAVFEGIRHVLLPGGRLFLCLCGPRYEDRQHHIAKGALPLRTYSVERILDLLPWAMGEAYSFNVMLDAVPNLPVGLLARLMALERVITRGWLSWGLWTVFDGVKRG